MTRIPSYDHDELDPSYSDEYKRFGWRQEVDEPPEIEQDHTEISESVWRSAIIKFVRVGWLEGVRYCAQHTTESDLKYILKRQAWEDIMPAPAEVELLYDAIESLDLEAVLRFQTHHGKRLDGGKYAGEPMSEVMFELFDEAYTMKQNGDPDYELLDAARETDGYVPQAVFDWHWCWAQVKDFVPVGERRSISDHSWEGLPTMVYDEHTYEGNQYGVEYTLISGHPWCHRALSSIVHVGGGWPEVWLQIRNSPTVRDTRQTLFDGE